MRKILERIQIFHFSLGAEFRGAAQPHADVRVATQRTFLHVAIAHFGVFEDLLQRREVRIRLGGRAQVRLGHDLDQRHATAVEVEVAPEVGIRETFVEAFAGVVFHVQTCDADALLCAPDLDFESARGGKGKLVHRDLVALGQVGVKVILARKSRARLNLASDGERRAQSQLQRALIQHWQGPRQPQTHGTGVGIRGSAEFGRAAAECFGPRLQLGVDFEADDGFVAVHGIRRNEGRVVCGSAHDRRKIIASGRAGRVSAA